MKNFVQEFLSDEKNIDSREGKTFILRKSYICNDGFYMSIQASNCHYSKPFCGETNVTFTHVEVRCEPTEEFEPYSDDETEEGDRVYGYVPVDVVNKVIMKHNQKALKEYTIELERSKTDEERWRHFEHSLEVILSEKRWVNDDLFDLLQIKQSIIIFMAKDQFKESNEIFLNNAKNFFYQSIQNIENRNPKVSFLYIKLFMEDYYFNKNKEE